jgi:hypothetical protein
MGTNKPPTYGWRERFQTYAMVAVIIAAIAVLGSMVAAIASWLADFLVRHPELI